MHFHTKFGSGEVYFNEESSSSEGEDEESGSEDPVTSINFYYKRKNPFLMFAFSLQNRIRSTGGDLEMPGSSSFSVPMSVIEVPPPPRLNNGGMGARMVGGGGHGRMVGGGDVSWTLPCGGGRTRRFLELESVNSVSKVDQFARVFFPVSFMAINVFYWYSYLYKNPPFL